MKSVTNIANCVYTITILLILRQNMIWDASGIEYQRWTLVIDHLVSFQSLTNEPTSHLQPDLALIRDPVDINSQWVGTECYVDPQSNNDISFTPQRTRPRLQPVISAVNCRSIAGYAQNDIHRKSRHWSRVMCTRECDWRHERNPKYDAMPIAVIDLRALWGGTAIYLLISIRLSFVTLGSVPATIVSWTTFVQILAFAIWSPTWS